MRLHLEYQKQGVPEYSAALTITTSPAHGHSWLIPNLAASTSPGLCLPVLLWHHSLLSPRSLLLGGEFCSRPSSTCLEE